MDHGVELLSTGRRRRRRRGFGGQPSSILIYHNRNQSMRGHDGKKQRVRNDRRVSSNRHPDTLKRRPNTLKRIKKIIEIGIEKSKNNNVKIK